MNKGFFRDVRLSDLDALVSLTAQSLDFSRYCDTEEKCLAFGRGFVLRHLCESAFAQVYEGEGEVKGVLLGTIEKALLLFDASLSKEAERQYAIAFGPDRGKDIYGEACEGMKKATGLSFSGEVTLLSLKSVARGKGLARSLLKAYCREVLKYWNGKPIYLYSDTDCNYGFYPHVGFKKLGERTIDFDLGPERNGLLTCFLFVADPKILVANL